MSKTAKLMAIATGAVAALIISENLSGKVPEGGKLIHSGANHETYMDFAEYFEKKFHSSTTIEDVADLWAVWSKDHNIPESTESDEPAAEAPKTGGDSFFIPQPDGVHHHVHSGLGVSKHRKDVLNGAIEALGIAPSNTVSALISGASEIAESHAELALIGFLVSEKIHKYKARKEDIGQMISEILGGKGRDNPRVSISGSGSGDNKAIREVLQKLRDL